MAYWWQIESMLGYLQEILAHINYTRTSSIYKKTGLCRYLFDALNKTWTAFNDFQGELGRADIQSFTQLLIEGIPNKYIEEFVESKELQDLVNFEPQIMNHNTLRRNGYRPDQEIEPQLVKKASREHSKVVNAYNKYLFHQNDEVKERVIKRVAELLYIVRSNIAHGEKTPYGPDLKKKKRDEEVCKVIIPLQRLLLNVLFDYPDRKLVVYGTLTPGNVNHQIISEIQGDWGNCVVNGHVREINGLTFFSWDPHGPPLKAQLFTSSLLPNRWKQIDEFEGSSYKRILIPIAKNDEIAIANIYVTIKNSEVRKWRR